MHEKESIIGRYKPESGSYVVEDDYKLVKDEKHKAPVLAIRTSTSGGFLELENASFRLIKTFKFYDSLETKIRVELLRASIKGYFSVILNPKETISPLWYTKDLGPEGFEGIYSKLEVRQLCDLPQPLVAIKERFAHVKYERSYDVEIRNAILTQDFPGAFFETPIAESEYNFISTDASITPVTQ